MTQLDPALLWHYGLVQVAAGPSVVFWTRFGRHPAHLREMDGGGNEVLVQKGTWCLESGVSHHILRTTRVSFSSPHLGRPSSMCVVQSISNQLHDKH